MGDHVIGYIMIVAGDDDFGQDIAFIAVVFQGLFGAEVVETVGTGTGGVVR